MKNFSVKVDGKEYWISRSVATCTFVFKEINNNVYALVERRGNGAADNKGKLCTSCGYLDFDETLKECAVRELKEECGFIASKDKLKFMGITSSPSENNQNVTIHYVYNAESNEDFDIKKAIGGEKDEVSEVKWLKIGHLIKNTLYVNIYDILNEKWAFDHDKLLIKYLSKFYKLTYEKKKEETDRN